MTSFSWLFCVAGSLSPHWLESQENPLIFCYLIVGMLLARQKAAAARNIEGTCLARCATYFTSSTTFKG